MSDLYVIDPGDPEEQSDMRIAERLGMALEKFYPDHPWVVSVQGGAIIIRHREIAQVVSFEMGRDGFGAVLPRKATDTPKSIVASAKEFGGRLLEAFGLPRGRWNGEKPVLPKGWGYKKSQGF